METKVIPLSQYMFILAIILAVYVLIKVQLINLERRIDDLEVNDEFKHLD